ncbi:hypothetical protein OIU74_020920 [Salix koriyanagi]|uniref:Uncharacterized protein n=1 Tax=Salix koriyanagi TaxID=2511006 RepID=A0A9Q0SM37_9ROSI|nr:hypothetical protein OIU74_020920 [Salix koriyanagi]
MARSMLAQPSTVPLLLPNGSTPCWLLSLAPLMTLGRPLSALDPPATLPPMTFRFRIHGLSTLFRIITQKKSMWGYSIRLFRLQNNTMGSKPINSKQRAQHLKLPGPRPKCQNHRV